jgi:hypothetical protein
VSTSARLMVSVSGITAMSDSIGAGPRLAPRLLAAFAH